MRFRSSSRLAAAAVFGLLAVGCTTASVPPTGPGFLGDASVYESLQQSPRDPDIWLSRSSQRSYRDFQMVMLEPVEFVSKSGAPVTVDEKIQAIELTRMFRKVMEVEVGDRYPIVERPGPKVIRLRTAIVGFDAADRTLLGLGSGASLEAEMTDSLSGERIVSAVARVRGSASRGRAARARANEILRYWARMMRDRMDFERR